MEILGLAWSFIWELVRAEVVSALVVARVLGIGHRIGDGLWICMEYRVEGWNRLELSLLAIDYSVACSCFR